jgi:hypothetical protein
MEGCRLSAQTTADNRDVASRGWAGHRGKISLTVKHTNSRKPLEARWDGNRLDRRFTAERGYLCFLSQNRWATDNDILPSIAMT